MNIDSFTDEQLLNLINHTIIEETNFSIDDLTGAYIQSNIASKNKLTVHKIVFLFGYDKNKNSRQYQKEISTDTYFIWCKAVLLKINSLIVNNIGSEYDEINRRMNKKESNIKKKEVIGNKVIGIGKSRTKVVRTPYEKEFSFNLKKKTQYNNLSGEYKKKLKAKCLLADGDIARYEDFIVQLEAKGYGYINFYKAYLAWDKDKLYKRYNPKVEPLLGDDWRQIVLSPKNIIAINIKTLEIKEAKIEDNVVFEPPTQTKKRDISKLIGASGCIQKM